MAAWAVLILVTIVPGLLWLMYFYRKDIYEPEPKNIVLRSFMLGMAAVLAAALIEILFRDGLESARLSGDLFGLFLYSFLGIGLVEEGLKMAVIWFSAYRSPEFNEIMDGIIYGTSVGLGFAALENLFYARAWGLWIALSRAVLTCLAHALFSGLAGFFMALARFNPEKRTGYMLKGLLITSFWHGIYDFLLLSPYPLWRFGSLLIVLGLAFTIGRKITFAQHFSPFRKAKED